MHSKPHPLIEINNVCLTIPGRPRPVLNSINYQIFPGDFVILLGSNGSGKSSLLKLIDRRYSACEGSLLLDNQELNSFSSKIFACKVVTITQNPRDSLFGNLSVLENCVLALGRQQQLVLELKTHGARNFFEKYLQQFNSNLSRHLDASTSKLSGGEQQALVLALSVLHAPDLLLLDEHTSALDPLAASRLMKLTAEVIDSKKITCVLTTHDLNVALKYGNRVLALKDGVVCAEIDAKMKPMMDRDLLLTKCY